MNNGRSFRQLATLCLLMLGCGVGEAGNRADLRLYIWQDYISENVLSAFTNSTGLRVEPIPFGSEEQRDNRMFSSLPLDIDLILLDSAVMDAYATADIISNLQRYGSEPWQRIEPRYREACGSHGLPYAWGTEGFAYRTNVVAGALRSWRDLFAAAPALHGRLILPDNSSELVGAALLALGFPYDSIDTGQLRSAQDLLNRTAEHVLQFGYTMNLQFNASLRAIDVAAIYMYSSDFPAFTALSPHDDWQYVYPTDGSILWVDCLAVLERSEHKDHAMQLLAYLSQPEQAAQNLRDVEVATPVAGARALLGSEWEAGQSTYPPEDALDNVKPFFLARDPAFLSVRHAIRYAVTLFRHED